MPDPILEPFFQALGLTGANDPTIRDVDEYYHLCFTQLWTQENLTTKDVARMQKGYDDAYSVLLQAFAQANGQRRQYRSRSDLSHVNATLRRDDSGVEDCWRNGANAPKDFDITLSNQSAAIVLKESPKETKKKSNNELGNSEHDNVDHNVRVVNSASDRSKDGIVELKHQSQHAFRLIEIRCDFWEAPEHSVIVHSVNCLGRWGCGFALQLKTNYPNAFAVYRRHCSSVSIPQLRGTTLLIPPLSGDRVRRGQRQRQLWIACLFTSSGYRNKIKDNTNPGLDSIDTVLESTDRALTHLRVSLEGMSERSGRRRPQNIFSPKLNAGNFGVPWEKSQRLIKKNFKDYSGMWHVMQWTPMAPFPIA